MMLVSQVEPEFEPARRSFWKVFSFGTWTCWTMDVQARDLRRKWGSYSLLAGVSYVRHKKDGSPRS